MNTIEKIQRWFLSQCNGDWEHQSGVLIETLDNPGWSVKIDLTGTELENMKFEEYSYGVGEVAEPGGDDWLVCKVEDRQFIGFGGPEKLEAILIVFLNWAGKRSEPGA